MTVDHELEAVVETVLTADPDGQRTATVLRSTLDQLYDGQRTGRYRWDQLHKTEKTHCGTLVEINMQREFLFEDGSKLDFSIAGSDVDCKYSQSKAGWMVPLEAHGELLLGLWADDEASRWSMGVVRATPSRLSGGGGNRDKKRSLSAEGRSAVTWLYDDAPLPENTLLHLPRSVVDYIFEPAGDRKGNERVRRLFRVVQHQPISRTAIATAAQQVDYMKRVRYNGGARSALQPEGIVILGPWDEHRKIARALRLPESQAGQEVSARLAIADGPGVGTVELEGQLWRLAGPQDPPVRAPTVPLP